MNIYTKTGDSGMTSLSNGENVQKFDIRIKTLALFDELNCQIGLVKSIIKDEETVAFLLSVQKTLTRIMSHVSDCENKGYLINEKRVFELEAEIDRLQTLYPRQSQFSTPGENEVSAQIDIARTTARQAEISLAETASKQFVCKTIMAFCNRISDYLYVLARYHDFMRIIYKEVINAIGHKTEKINCLNLETAKLLMDRVEKKAREQGLNAVIAICNGHGNPIAVHVMDGAYLVSFEIALSKAYTSAALKMTTEMLNKLSQPGEMFYGIESLKNEKILIIGGGVPLFVRGEVIGSIGVSGGTDVQDIALANYGLEVFENGIQ